MKLFPRFLLIIPIVFLGLIDKTDASFSLNLILSLTKYPIYRRYHGILSRYLGQDLIKLLPPCPQVEPELITDIEADEKKVVTFLTDNSELVLGDVLRNIEGDVFFFMSPFKLDGISTTLTRASTGLFEQNHRINDYFLVKKSEPTDIHELLDYSSDPIVKDKFKIIQIYEGYALIMSTKIGVVFVAPKDGIDEFIRGEFQGRIQERREKEMKKEEREKKRIMEYLSLDNFVLSAESEKTQLKSPVARTRKQPSSSTSSIKPSSIEAFISPDSVTFNYHSPSPIEILFGRKDGPTEFRLKFIKEKFIEMLIKKTLKVSDALTIVRSADNIFRFEKTIVDVNIREGQKITIFGDIHGQFLDLIRILNDLEWPSQENLFLFNGDIVDRGKGSIECLLLLYVLKITFPLSVFINRGNHESESCSPEKFYHDSMHFDESGEFYQTCQEGFKSLPISHVINERIYIVHGGIRSNFHVKSIAEMDRINPCEEMKEIAEISMWDDPSETPGISLNPHRNNLSYLFGPDITQTFLQQNNLDLLIRSHTYIPEGIQFSQSGQCWTVFSAPNYCGFRGNRAGVITFDSELTPQYSYFKSRND